MKHKIINGDCIEVMRAIDNAEVDLIYLDPPFGSNEIDKCFNISWKNIQQYSEWIEPTLRECYRVLKDTGSMYLHCDWHANAHLRILMDKIFGENNFRNEIIWHYTGRRMKSKLRLNSKHDTIFYYAKSGKNKIIDYPIEHYTRKEYLKMKKQALHTDNDGREWIWGHAGKGKSHEYKIYIDEVLKEGRAIDSVWDIPIINTSDKERLGYPTQKPEKLLERIVKASSNPTDVILDPMCGCGTCIDVAHKLGRQWIGIDVSPTACKLSYQRISKEVLQLKMDRKQPVIEKIGF